jgi:hypothetical protein
LLYAYIASGVKVFEHIRLFVFVAQSVPVIISYKLVVIAEAEAGVE